MRDRATRASLRALKRVARRRGYDLIVRHRPWVTPASVQRFDFGHARVLVAVIDSDRDAAVQRAALGRLAHDLDDFLASGPTFHAVTEGGG